jgi:hypothetical protein
MLPGGLSRWTPCGKEQTRHRFHHEWVSSTTCLALTAAAKKLQQLDRK